jgi:uncharacterized protein (DUF302 family)
MRAAMMALVIVVLVTSAVAAAEESGRVTLTTPAPFARAAAALEQAISNNKMALVCHANAQQGAAGRGVAMKGNQVLMVFRNDFAVRLVAADPATGFEAPIRIYIYENGDGTATISYVPPSRLFARYNHPEVNKVAAELDAIFGAIVNRALAAR